MSRCFCSVARCRGGTWGGGHLSRFSLACLRARAAGNRGLDPAGLPRLGQPAGRVRVDRGRPLSYNHMLSRSIAAAFGEPHSSGVFSYGRETGPRIRFSRLSEPGLKTTLNEVVFPQYPFLGEIKRILAGDPGTEDAASMQASPGLVRPFSGCTHLGSGPGGTVRLERHGVMAWSPDVASQRVLAHYDGGRRGLTRSGRTQLGDRLMVGQVPLEHFV